MLQLDFAEIEHKGDSEEKDDMWKLWNKVYDDKKGGNNSGGLTKKPSVVEMKDDSTHSKSDYAYKVIPILIILYLFLSLMNAHFFLLIIMMIVHQI